MSRKKSLSFHKDVIPLWRFLGLGPHFRNSEVDKAYQEFGSKNKNVRLAWKVLRDEYFGSAYKKLRSSAQIREAGFFEDKRTIEDIANASKDFVSSYASKPVFTDIRKSARPPVVILMCGAFSPLHMGHIRALELARETLEKKGMKVIGGYVSPAHDDYVLKKNGDNKYFTHEYRLKQCKSALKKVPWLAVDSWECLQPKEVTYTEVIKRLKGFCKGNDSYKRNIKIFLLVGSDNASYCRSFMLRGNCVCIERFRYSDRFAATKLEMQRYRRVIFVPYKEELLKLSSTSIREARKHGRRPVDR